MKNKSTTAPSLNSKSKDTPVKNQLQTIFLYLSEHVATATMVSKVTNVPQKNICRYKKDLEKRGLLKEIEKKICTITGFKAWYISTNPDLFHSSNQTKLF